MLCGGFRNMVQGCAAGCEQQLAVSTETPQNELPCQGKHELRPFEHQSTHK